MGRPAVDKEEALLAVASVLDAADVPYAVMGGIAVQVHTDEPRTTLDIDVALKSKADVPTEALRAAGFTHDGTFPFSDNWRAPGAPGVPRKQRIAVQFSADDLTSAAVDHAGTVELDGVPLSVVTVEDLLILKLAAASEPRRRASKRLSDYSDIVRLIEEHPEVVDEIDDLDVRLAVIHALLAPTPLR